MCARTIVLGYEDYAALPLDGRRYEIHEGELSGTPAPTPQHQLVTRNLFRLVDQHVRATRAGEVLFAPIDVILSETSIVQPDLVFVDRNRLDAISRRGIEGAPTLVVEVLSPTTALIDRRTKAKLYAQYGVPCLWLVDPEARTIEAFVLEPGGYAPAGRAIGTEPASFPPFPDLAIVPTTLWP
jgi:Uma2 family endonuclease